MRSLCRYDHTTPHAPGDKRSRQQLLLEHGEVALQAGIMLGRIAVLR